MKRTPRIVRATRRRIVLAMLFGVWAAALFMPAVVVQGRQPFSGFAILSRGWQGIDAGVYAWLANPLFLIALGVCWFRSYEVAGIVAGVGCVLALTSFAAAGIARDAGAAVPDLSLSAGFYLWLLAQLGLLASSWLWAFRPAHTAKG